MLPYGLDEYGGNHRELQKAESVKLCVSSLEWNVFADAFQVGTYLPSSSSCPRDGEFSLDPRT